MALVIGRRRLGSRSLRTRHDGRLRLSYRFHQATGQFPAGSASAMGKQVPYGERVRGGSRWMLEREVTASTIGHRRHLGLDAVTFSAIQALNNPGPLLRATLV